MHRQQAQQLHARVTRTAEDADLDHAAPRFPTKENGILAEAVLTGHTTAPEECESRQGKNGAPCGARQLSSLLLLSRLFA